MVLALAQICSLRILFSCRDAVPEEQTTRIYHPGDTISGFVKVIGHADIFLDNLSISLEGELLQTEPADILADAFIGTVRIWESNGARQETFSALQHTVSVYLSSSSKIK
jgi:hypothetical protein